MTYDEVLNLPVNKIFYTRLEQTIWAMLKFNDDSCSLRCTQLGNKTEALIEDTLYGKTMDGFGNANFDELTDDVFLGYSYNTITCRYSI